MKSTGQKTILFGGSGLLGPIILELYPDMISVGRTVPPSYIKNKHIHIDDIGDLSVLDELDFDKVIFMIGNSNHHEINTKCMMGFEYNVIPLKKALHYFQKRNLKKFIAFTTILLYDVLKLKLPVGENQPINPYINDYVFSKYIAEEVTKFYKKVPIINVRLSNIYGPTKFIRPDLVPTLIQSSLSPAQAEVWSTKPVRDFIYAKDAAHAVVALLDSDYTGPVNLGSGEMRSVGDIVSIIENLSGKKVKVLDVPVNGPMKFVTDISLLKKLTGWKPEYTLESGFEETYKIMAKYAPECRWWEKNPKK
ncbi:MAG: NAD(P)-dependent oxidoreductase [bacterium]|nr:NAD(P)-dependent oxidoreductase [bacterium]